MVSSKITIPLILLLASVFVAGNIAQAKRIPPPNVDPVFYKGIKFIAPPERIGYVEAWDTVTNQKIWERKVYTVFINPFVEKDVQYVYIVSLRIENGELVIINERGKKYIVAIPQTIIDKAQEVR